MCMCEKECKWRKWGMAEEMGSLTRIAEKILRGVLEWVIPIPTLVGVTDIISNP